MIPLECGRGRRRIAGRRWWRGRRRRRAGVGEAARDRRRRGVDGDVAGLRIDRARQDEEPLVAAHRHARVGDLGTADEAARHAFVEREGERRHQQREERADLRAVGEDHASVAVRCLLAGVEEPEVVEIPVGGDQRRCLDRGVGRDRVVHAQDRHRVTQLLRRSPRNPQSRAELEPAEALESPRADAARSDDHPRAVGRHPDLFGGGAGTGHAVGAFGEDRSREHPGDLGVRIDRHQLEDGAVARVGRQRDIQALRLRSYRDEVRRTRRDGS